MTRSTRADLQPDQGPALTVGEDGFRLLVEGVRDYAIFMLDPAGYISSWNAGAERLKGYQREEILGQHFSIFYPEVDLAAGKPAMELEATLRDGRFEDEGWRVRKDGTLFWANVVITAIYDESGTLVGFAKVTRDLTERRRGEEELRQSEQRLRLLIDSIQDYAVFMLEPDGRVATWNPGAERIQGYRADEILGRSFTTFYLAEDVRAGKGDMELAVAARSGRFEDEGWRVRADGTRFWANVVISAVRDARGTLIGFAKVTRDLTDRKHAEEEQAARRAAEQANRAKDQFLAVLGHELRNPLAPIVTALEILKLRGDGQLSREQEIIERQVKHMVRLVDDLLDMARITKGSLELKRQRLDLRDVVARAIETVAPLLERRAHHFDVAVPPAPLWVDADDARLTQVFVNLLTNSAKYTEPRGRVAVDIRRDGDEAVIAISDSGIGIAPELLPKVFDLFVQGEQGAERAGGGLGIGLSLVRNLVGLHGGSVGAASTGVGGGSTFTVRLPAIAAAAASAAPLPGHTPHNLACAPGRRILIVDDNSDALELIAELLQVMGHEVRTASDGPGALEVVKRFHPDVAILDIGLPVMDGYELARRLADILGPDTPRMIALTGYGQAHDRERSRRAGFSSHLVKPVDIDLLLRSIGVDPPNDDD